jgi:hypothetical protein
VLGPPKPRHLDTPVLVSLEDLVPAGNFYRHLETKLDLGFVREWAHELYAERGRPSIDPVVFFKLQLIMFLERHSLVSTLLASNPAARWPSSSRRFDHLIRAVLGVMTERERTHAGLVMAMPLP